MSINNLLATAFIDKTRVIYLSNSINDVHSFYDNGEVYFLLPKQGTFMIYGSHFFTRVQVDLMLSTFDMEPGAYKIQKEDNAKYYSVTHCRA